MSDLRDQIHRTDDDQVFLAYHNNSPWAKEKVARGLKLNPQAVEYMKRELAESARAQAEYEAKITNAKEPVDAQQQTNAPPAEPDAERDTRATVIRRHEQPETPGG